jgi:alpha-beta hydrolase superfamily lysophospholipase
MNEEFFNGRAGTRIFMRSWRPQEQPRAVIVICHGVNSHSGQYLWAAERLQAEGFAVYAYDHRGRGRSAGPRFYIDDIEDYTQDLGTVIKLVKEREPGLKIFLLGHSAGGVISCTYALDHQVELAGFICESFAFQVPAPGFVLAIIRGLARIAPTLPVLKLKNRDFTRDQTALAALETDPLIKGEIQPARTVAALLRATDRMRREFSTITLPVLIMHGTEDKATVPAGSQRFYDEAGSTDKTLRLYDGHFHDLLNDIGKEGVMDEIVRWIRKRTEVQRAAA